MQKTEAFEAFDETYKIMGEADECTRRSMRRTSKEKNEIIERLYQEIDETDT